MIPVGEVIGEGKARRVHAHPTDPTLVIKIQKRRKGLANANEWRNWHAIKGTEWEPYFAPCVEAGDGWMTQIRAEPVGDRHSDVVPKVCRNDRKKENFGVIDGRIVCVDYANFRPADLTKRVSFIKSRWERP